MNDDFENDIPTNVARAAHLGTSFEPEKRAETERTEYARTLRADHDILLALATTPEKQAILATEFLRYRAGLKARTLAHLHAKSRIVSVMIAGPSNFPVRQMEKRNQTEHRRLEELFSFRERALAAIRRKLTPELAPIMTGDEDAVERLTEKLAKLEADQKLMRSVNEVIRRERKNGEEAQLAALLKLGLKENTARELLTPDVFQCVGVPKYRLTNNAAEIRRAKKRLEHLKVVKAEPTRIVEGSLARMEDVPPDNRVRLFFPGKPDAAVRERLKRGGYRWAPTGGCWQAYRNHGTLTLAKSLIGEPIAPLTQVFDPRFADACFYEPGVLARLSGPLGEACVEVQGDLRLSNDSRGLDLRTAAQARAAFPTGELPEDGDEGWSWGMNRWWAATLVSDAHGEDDVVCDSYEVALEAARALAGFTQPRLDPEPFAPSAA